jgi:hypothetical protein
VTPVCQKREGSGHDQHTGQERGGRYGSVGQDASSLSAILERPAGYPRVQQSAEHADEYQVTGEGRGEYETTQRRFRKEPDEYLLREKHPYY